MHLYATRCDIHGHVTSSHPVETVHLHWHHAAYLTFPRSLWNYKCIICLQIPPWRSSPRNHISVSVPITHRLFLWTVSRCLHLRGNRSCDNSRRCSKRFFCLRLPQSGFSWEEISQERHLIHFTPLNGNGCKSQLYHVGIFEISLLFLRRNCGGKVATDTRAHTPVKASLIGPSEANETSM